MAQSLVAMAAVLLGAPQLRVQAARHNSALMRIDIENLDDASARLPEGVPLHPLDKAGPEVEAALFHSAFECHNGRIIAIRLPPKPPQRETFSLVHMDPLAPLHPVQVYSDLSDTTTQFLLFPPSDSADGWRLLFSKTAQDAHGVEPVYVEQRLFEVRGGHPCAAEAPAETPATASEDGSVRQSTDEREAMADESEADASSDVATSAAAKPAAEAKSEGGYESDSESGRVAAEVEDAELEDVDLESEAESEAEAEADMEDMDPESEAEAGGEGKKVAEAKVQAQEPQPAVAPEPARADGEVEEDGAVVEFAKKLWGMMFRARDLWETK